MERAKCQECEWEGDTQACDELRNAHERVQAGDIMPAGQCPECGAAAMLVERKGEPCARIVTVAEYDAGTHFAKRNVADGLAAVMAVTGNRYEYAAKEDPGTGWTVTVRRARPYREMVLHGYLRIEAG